MIHCSSMPEVLFTVCFVCLAQHLDKVIAFKRISTYSDMHADMYHTRVRKARIINWSGCWGYIIAKCNHTQPLHPMLRWLSDRKINDHTRDKSARGTRGRTNDKEDGMKQNGMAWSEKVNKDTQIIKLYEWPNRFTSGRVRRKSRK